MITLKKATLAAAVIGAGLAFSTTSQAAPVLPSLNSVIAGDVATSEVNVDKAGFRRGFRGRRGFRRGFRGRRFGFRRGFRGRRSGFRRGFRRGGFGFRRGFGFGHGYYGHGFGHGFGHF